MSFELPGCGFVLWPVGCGDSTTIVIDTERVMQVDIHHVEKSDDDDDPRWPVVDHLVAGLPKRGGKPYLAAFVLTHLDSDHVKGFAELLKRAQIGELWFTPRVFQELEDSEDMCDDAVAFCGEARRRIKKIVAGGTPASGDRVRILGWSEILADGDFGKIPAAYKTVPGTAVTNIDGTNVSTIFRAFIHAPFKDDADGERNRTSIGMQVALNPGSKQTAAMLLGDLDHPPVKRIFDISQAADLAWNIFLAPHHCSKSVMYVKLDGVDLLDEDIVDAIANAGEEERWIVSSSPPIPASNKPGDNPPHAKAKARYETIVEDGAFLCTGEHGGTESPRPIVFVVTPAGRTYAEPKTAKPKKSSVADAILRARGGDAPHGTTVGFGKPDDD